MNNICSNVFVPEIPNIFVPDFLTYFFVTSHNFLLLSTLYQNDILVNQKIMKDKDKEKFNKQFFFQNYFAEDDWKNIMNKENMNFNSILHSFLNKFPNKNAPLNKQQKKIFDDKEKKEVYFKTISREISMGDVV